MLSRIPTPLPLLLLPLLAAPLAAQAASDAVDTDAAERLFHGPRLRRARG